MLYKGLKNSVFERMETLFTECDLILELEQVDDCHARNWFPSGTDSASV
jgi:hypothetical protein